jgi:hypothetical protein
VEIGGGSVLRFAPMALNVGVTDGLGFDSIPVHDLIETWIGGGGSEVELSIW